MGGGAFASWIFNALVDVVSPRRRHCRRLQLSPEELFLCVIFLVEVRQVLPAVLSVHHVGWIDELEELVVT